ncbi:MAG: FtsX-like permease family protein [Candidatus Peregrinibacteria bacterium]
MQTLMRFIRPAFDPFFRSPVQSIWTVVFLSILFFLIFLLLLMGIITKQSIATAKKEVDLAFFFVEGVSEHKVTETVNRLEKLKEAGNIEQYHYFSQEDNREQFHQKYPQEFEFIIRHDDLKNTFRASLEIIPKSMTVNELQDYFLSPDFSGVIDVDAMKENEKQRTQSQRVLDVLGFLQMGIYSLALIFFFGILSVLGAFISSSFALRQKEIFIMRLVGASHLLIRSPFLLEGVFITIFGGAFGMGILFVLWYTVVPQVLSVFETIESRHQMADTLNVLLNQFYGIMPEFSMGVIAISLLVSFTTVEKYLRQKNLLAGGD